MRSTGSVILAIATVVASLFFATVQLSRDPVRVGALAIAPDIGVSWAGMQDASNGAPGQSVAPASTPSMDTSPARVCVPEAHSWRRSILALADDLLDMGAQPASARNCTAA